MVEYYQQKALMNTSSKVSNMSMLGWCTVQTVVLRPARLARKPNFTSLAHLRPVRGFK